MCESHKSRAEPVAWRPEVVAFANLMESVLRDNDDKDGWKDCGPRWLFERLKEEVAELDDAGQWKPDSGPMEGSHGRRLARECADVANFAMMIADVSGGLPLSASPPSSRAEVVEECAKIADKFLGTHSGGRSTAREIATAIRASLHKPT